VEGQVGVATDVQQDGGEPGEGDERDAPEQRPGEAAFEEDRPEERAGEDARRQRADAGAGFGHPDGIAVGEDDGVAAHADGVVVRAQDA